MLNPLASFPLPPIYPSNTYDTPENPTISTATTTTLRRTRARTLTLSNATNLPPSLRAGKHKPLPLLPPLPKSSKSSSPSYARVYTTLHSATIGQHARPRLPSPVYQATGRQLKPIIRPTTLVPIASLGLQSGKTPSGRDFEFGGSLYGVWELLERVDKDVRVEIGRRRAEILDLGSKIGDYKEEQLVW